MISNKIIDIKKLSQDRPLNTPELFPFNDCFGYAHTLKKYAKFKQVYQIKGILEHHSNLLKNPQSDQLLFPLPAIFTFSVHKFLKLREITNKAMFALGPPIHYAESLFSEEEINGLKKSLGKTLLVFLPYSTMPYLVTFDHSKVINEIKKIEKNYENILICLGWTEILRDVEKPYSAEGYTCVTAGHIFDLNFLPRLKSIILLADHTLSFSTLDFLGYCIYLNKPHWIIQIDVDIDPSQLKNNYLKSLDYTLKGEKIINSYKEPREDITDKQKEIADIVWGISCVKSSEELEEIFQITEDMFNNGYLPNNHRDPIMLCQIIDYLDKNKNEKAKKLFGLSKHLYFHDSWQCYLKAAIAIGENKIEKATQLILKLEKYNPFFKQLSKSLKASLESPNYNKNILKKLWDTYPRPLYYKTKKSF